MLNQPIHAQILAVRIIAQVSPDLAASLGLKPEQRSIGIITTDIDDVSYAALDEATKKADVTVAYAKSLYAGSANASTKLAGEFIGILAGPCPAEIKSGIAAMQDYMANEACFYSANAEGSVVYFAHCISRTGSFLSKLAGVAEGDALAYLIAPPLEGVFGLDAALKAADVRVTNFYGPPTETNFAGALLHGLQADCRAACQAFAAAVIEIAADPLVF